jgi:hypothetical protein
MLPDWFTRPESVYRTVLWLLGPFFAWWIGKTILRQAEAWYAARTEANARASLVSYYKALDNPPTLLESLAYIVCFLPLPVFLGAGIGLLYFLPYPSPAKVVAYPHLAQELRSTALIILFFIAYLLFGALTAQGLFVVSRLRHGEARYAKNYKAEIQGRIDKLKKKFPTL